MAVAIGKIITNGIIFDVKNWNHPVMNTNDIVELVDSLFNTLEQRKINYLLVGGLALLSYIAGRNTQDIDFIISKT